MYRQLSPPGLPPWNPRVPQNTGGRKWVTLPFSSLLGYCFPSINIVKYIYGRHCYRTHRIFRASPESIPRYSRHPHNHGYCLLALVPWIKRNSFLLFCSPSALTVLTIGIFYSHSLSCVFPSPEIPVQILQRLPDCLSVLIKASTSALKKQKNPS